MKEISLGTFQENLKPALVKIFKLIPSSMALGMWSFFMVILWLYFKKESSGSSSMSLKVFPVLTTVNLIFFVILLPISNFAYNFIVNVSRLSKPVILKSGFEGENNKIEYRIIGIIFLGMIIRFAILEFSGIFGLVVFFISTWTGQINEFEYLWINLLPFIVVTSFMISLFPTRNKIEQTFVERFLEVQ